MNELKSPQAWIKLAVVILSAVAATWPGKPAAQFCSAISAGIAAIWLGATPALAARAARAKKE